jgi:GNAT superfamily N-acetyltransferase
MGASRLTIRASACTEDLELVVQYHAAWYAEACGFDGSFPPYVAAALEEIVARREKGDSALWVAEAGGEFAGSIGVVGRDGGKGGTFGQLRVFLVRPKFCRCGLGRRLLGEALAFCRARGFSSVTLWTVRGLDAAAHLYREAGFVMVEEVTNRQWGQMVTEERWELRLGGRS